MALLGVNGPLPPPRVFSPLPPPGAKFRPHNHRQDHEQYFQIVPVPGGDHGETAPHMSEAAKQAIQEKFNYIKNVLREKFYKNQERDGHYEGATKGEVKDQSAAVSALTLLAFLFFLYILQSCIKDHMNQMMAADMTTTPAPAYFRSQSRRRGEKNGKPLVYDEYEETVDIQNDEDVNLPPTNLHHRTTSALQVYKDDSNILQSVKKQYETSEMEPVPLIIRP